MNLDELNFDCRPSASRSPLASRDASRMLLLDKTTGAWEDRHFREFPDLLRGDELIILNNARVLPARLFGRRVGIHAEPPGIHNPARHEHLQYPDRSSARPPTDARHLGNTRPPRQKNHP